MNEPLTIEELKALPLGEWVWVIDKCIYGNGIYCTIDCQDDDEPICILSSRINTQVYKFDDYGKTWTAYKNKEQAEGDIDYEIKYNTLHANVIDHCYKMDNKDYRKHFYDMTIGNRMQLIEQSQAVGEYDSRVEEAKKQTAKEILKRFKDEVLDYEEYNEMLPLYDLPTIAEKISYIAKEYGVEVEE
ncbi:MAG: hypothetical protein OSJ74_00170 [Clostridia bacterium]|nr:hypothetical protein [Clostridia bacterium]